MLYGLLLTLNALVCAALVFVVLMQRSEGGALGSGGGPTGLITTRGAGDLLTRTTWILFALFLSLSMALTLIGARERSSQAILNRLKGQSVNPAAFATPAPLSNTPSAPVAPVAPVGSLNAPPQTVTAPVASAPIARAPIVNAPIVHAPAAPAVAHPATVTPAKPAAAAKPAHAAKVAASPAAPAPITTITPPPPPPTPKADADTPAKSSTP